jgi:hypothetical protein
MYSQFELAFNVKCQHLFRAVLQSAVPCYCLYSPVSLNRNFAVLLPPPDVSRHVLELNFLLQKEVHLFFNWIFLAVAHERSAEINRSHCFEVFVRAAVAAHHSEIRVKQVFTVAAVRNAIVYYLLQ